MAHDDALGKGFVPCHGEPTSELGKPDEEQAQAVLRIHLIVGEQAQIFEDIVTPCLTLRRLFWVVSGDCDRFSESRDSQKQRVRSALEKCSAINL